MELKHKMQLFLTSKISTKHYNCCVLGKSVLAFTRNQPGTLKIALDVMEEELGEKN